VRLWSLAAGRPFVEAVREQNAAVTSVAFSLDGQRLAVGLESGSVRISDIGPRVAPDVEINGLPGAVQTVVFSPDGSRVLSAGADQVARLWSASSGQLLAELRGGNGRLTSAAFSSDGRRVATSAEDGTVRVWDAGSGQTVREIRAGEQALRRVTFTPDGRQVVTAGDEGAVRFWDVDSGREQRALTVLGGADVFALNVSRDGRLVVAGGGRTVAVWDITNGRRLAWLEGSTDVVQDAAFSPDGERVVVASGDGVVRLYRREMFAPLDELIGLIPLRMVQ
jgi:dipeptidyl aminopeptidase/acylaminoacyl peptidase